MATADAGQEGQTGQSNDTMTAARGIPMAYKPSAYNQTTLLRYKMMGKCSIHGWDYWENNSGDEAGRDVHGVQQAGTVVVTRSIPQDF